MYLSFNESSLKHKFESCSITIGVSTSTYRPTLILFKLIVRLYLKILITP